ncbi:hypothetical protein ACF0H5_009904 [Mactra antiquata]
MIVRFLSLLLVIQTSAASCPHESQTLRTFSEIFGTEITKSQTLTITENVLLDIESLEVDYIEIVQEGSLVFNQGIDITIKTKGINVKGNGALVIGSSECRHTDNVLIVLEGRRTVNRDALAKEGEKYIAVHDNGRLDIHGIERRSWTKLSATVDRFNAEPIDYHHQSTDAASNAKMGFCINVLNSDLSYSDYVTFGLRTTSVDRQERTIVKMAQYMSEISDGSVVGFTLSKQFIILDEVDFSAFCKFIEELVGMETGELLLRQAQQYDTFSLVFVVGGDNYDQSLQQQIGLQTTEARSGIVYQGKKIAAISKITPQLDAWIDFRVMDLELGYPEVTVTHDISTWKAGDQVLFTSTDFAWNHAEVRTIKEITGDRSFTLTHEFDYRHFGEIEDGVDMRGEVALLTRNVKIQGDQQRGCPAENSNCDEKDTKFIDTHGGHLKVFQFSSVVIEGAEFQFMGQLSDRGNYPIHFHMCEDITGKTALIRANSIHHTFRRAITVHGTFGTSEEQPGVQLIDNVAYHNFGHAYFLEDGAEKATILIGNLGASTRNIVNDFVTDRSKATTFWITNPKTVLIDNVAAGSEGFGIWYTFPLEPVGPSKGLAYEFEEAKRTPLWTIDNNVVHSNMRGGFNFDFILEDENGKVAACMRYTPSMNPLDEDSLGMEVQINRLTAYKNRDINVWLRGGWFDIYQLSGGTQQMFVKKSLFIGQSRGNSEEDGYPDAITPMDLGQYLGVVFHDGPTYFQNCWFNGFNSNGSYISGALGFAPKKKFHSSIVSSVTDMRFGFIDGINGNRVSDGLIDDSVQGVADFDNDETATFRDADGSVTRCPNDVSEWNGPVQVLKAEPSFLTEGCTYRDNWNMAICQGTYGKIHVGHPQADEDFDKSGQMRRRSFDDADEIYIEDHTNLPLTEYTVMLGSDTYYYEFQYTNEFPMSFRINAIGVEKYKSVILGVCLPEGVTSDDMFIGVRTPTDNAFSGIQMTWVDDLEDLRDDTTMRKVYLEGRMLYIRISSKKERNEHWDRHDTDHCAGDECPRVNIIMDKKFDYTPCFSTDVSQLSNTEVLNSVDDLDCTLPSSQPEADWGARDTLSNEDGNWGEWSGWSQCCNEGGNVVERTRFRLCDDPAPRGDGAACSGEELQLSECPFDCPVDGTQSEWSDWSECFCDGIAVGSGGVRTSNRVCTVANGGEFCKGSLTKVAMCRKKCGLLNENSVNGEWTEWSEWSDCFCDGVAEGSMGAQTRRRTCTGTANFGDFCSGQSDDYRSCDNDCVPELD